MPGMCVKLAVWIVPLGSVNLTAELMGVMEWSLLMQQF